MNYCGKSHNFKRGYISARNYTRQHPFAPVDADPVFNQSSSEDDFDDGWNAGTRDELKKWEK
jgi:hypothetical protein